MKSLQTKSRKIVALACASMAALLILVVLAPIMLDLGNQTPAENEDGIPPIKPFYWNNANPEVDYETEMFDENGVILKDLGQGWVYHPWRIAKYATDLYHRHYLTNSTEDYMAFFNQTEWLANNFQIFGDSGLWVYEFDNPYGVEKAPWWSVMSQGFGMAACLQAYSLRSEEEQYAEIAWLALKAYEHRIEEHGILGFWDDGEMWYEEYADNKTMGDDSSKHVLNGFIFGLSATYYLYEFNQSDFALSLWQEGISSLKEKTKEFDTGLWFKYSLANHRAYPDYQDIHMKQYSVLYNLTQDPFFAFWRDRINWMIDMPKNGYQPDVVWATSTVLSTHNTTYLRDHALYKKLPTGQHAYWSGRLPCSVYVDLGETRPINLVAIYGVYYSSTPRDFFIQMSIDNTSWDTVFEIENSKDWDKMILFSSPMEARHIKISFHSTIGQIPIVALDEIVISYLLGGDYEIAEYGITQGFLNSTHGCVQGTAPNGTLVSYGDVHYAVTNGTYEMWIPAGNRRLDLFYQGVSSFIDVHVKYGKRTVMDMV
ncbi:MAG: D-glucuronyl C5-epimerase family protein [Candidatus Thermoplasmatota archaeon]|nr:D-glucuronyl C5-epimerase family protein [Candidatus Thermoplasmatota archaeon]